METQFTSDCRALMRHEIAAAGGNEVFFIGRTNVDGIVCEAETIARGSKVAVPAIITRASGGDVVIHNHPTGDITPSNADMDIASRLQKRLQKGTCKRDVQKGRAKGDVVCWFARRQAPSP